MYYHSIVLLALFSCVHQKSMNFNTKGAKVLVKEKGQKCNYYFYRAKNPVEFRPSKTQTCSLYHENLFIQKVKVISTQVLNNFFSASDIMEAVPISMVQRFRDQLLVYFYNTAVENNFLIITRNSTAEHISWKKKYFIILRTNTSNSLI